MNGPGFGSDRRLKRAGRRADPGRVTVVSLLFFLLPLVVFAVVVRRAVRVFQMLRDPEQQPVIRDDFITQRNGRFVIPIRTDAPWQMKGIVHAASSSGASS